MPDPTFFATSTNRAACLGFTKALALQLAPEHILVNAVNIDFVVTPQWETIWQTHAHLEREEFFRQMAQQDVPPRHFGTPEEVAGIVAFLCSRRASYIWVPAWRRLDCQVEVGDRVMTASRLVGVA
jgi:NAD(P)-dependent dehydrogenase (short-subunit alcohol dehydrogenase family)